MTVPAYLPYYIFAGGVGIITAILLGLRLALAKANWPQPDRGATLRTASLILIGWFLVAIALGGLGVYQASSDRLPTIQYGIPLPILIACEREATARQKAPRLAPWRRRATSLPRAVTPAASLPSLSQSAPAAASWRP